MVNNFVLDHAYVPILWIYTAEEVRKALARVGFEVVEEFPQAFDFFQRLPLRRWTTGDGLLRAFVCRKPNFTNGPDR